MSVAIARIVEGKKFLWDGRTYASPAEAATARAGYERDGFETCLVEEEETFLVYTRRVVQQPAPAPND